MKRSFKYEDEINDRLNKKSKKNKGVKSNKLKVFLIYCCVTITLCCFAGLFLLYGTYAGFRDWLVTTAMTTMTHQYFATWFYDDATIDTILDNNKVLEASTPTDTNLIDFVDYSNQHNVTYANEYERQILEKELGNNDYKIIEIEEKKYSGYIAAIYDASRIHTVTTQYLGSKGEYLVDMVKRVNAPIAINGGGFDDPAYKSSGGSPVGIVMSKGKLVSSNTWKGGWGGVIGFDNDNKLVLAKYTATQAQAAGMRDCVTFGPFLIQDGKPNPVLGNGGWGEAGRTAIGQRADGIVLFLVLDGRRTGKPGADMDDLIMLMERYGAVNAAALDGGTSSVMVVNGEIINDPIDGNGRHQTRKIPTGFYLEPAE